MGVPDSAVVRGVARSQSAIRAERDRLAAELTHQRQPWPVRALWALFDCGPTRRRRAF